MSLPDQASIKAVTEAVKAKWPNHASVKTYRNEAEKEVVEIQVEISRGDGLNPLRAGMILNAKQITAETEKRVITHLTERLSE